MALVLKLSKHTLEPAFQEDWEKVYQEYAAYGQKYTDILSIYFCQAKKLNKLKEVLGLLERYSNEHPKISEHPEYIESLSDLFQKIYSEVLGLDAAAD